MRAAPEEDRKFAWAAGAASALAIIACYGPTLLLAVLAAAGMAVAINEGVWAGTVAVLALAAFAAALLGYRRHGAAGPVVLAGLGVALVLWALFVRYDWRVELVGFVGLALAAAWQWRLRAQ